MKIHIGEKSYCVSWTYYYYYYYFIIRRRTILNWVNGNLTTKLENDKNLTLIWHTVVVIQN